MAADLGLSKWYLDCVAHDGEAVVVYVAKLRWGALSIGYASFLRCRDGKTTVRTCLTGFVPPTVHDDCILWNSGALGIAGAWRTQSPRLTRTIIDSNLGRLEWDCLQPSASVSLRIDGRTIEGLGYVEEVRMTIPPWHVPLETLHWGRFLAPQVNGSESAGLVWVDLRGPSPARHVFLDGVDVTARDVSEGEITLADGGALLLDQREVLREGAVGETVLSAIPKLVKAVPARILGLYERKWRSRGVLIRPDGRESTGWAIHEVVRWP